MTVKFWIYPASATDFIRGSPLFLLSSSVCDWYSLSNAAIIIERIIQERLRDGFAIVTPPSNVKKEIEEDWHKSLTEYNPSIMNCFSRNKKYLKVSTYTGSKASSGSKGSGGSKSSKSSSTKTNKKIAKTWENPYDEFYNLQRAINKEIRIREQLEKEYTRILKARNSTIKELINKYFIDNSYPLMI